MKRTERLPATEETTFVGHLCEICGTYQDLEVDRDKVTGVVRGRLCHTCRVGVEMFQGDYELLSIARSYVLHHAQRRSEK